jgi:hypothetical protein
MLAVMITDSPALTNDIFMMNTSNAFEYADDLPSGFNSETTSRNLAGMFRRPCWSLKYFPERILTDDFSLCELEHVNASHFDVLP